VAGLVADATNRFDLIVFDTAPTGHSLRLLRLPELMSGWIEALAAKRRAATEAGDLAGGPSAESSGPPRADALLEILDARLSRLSLVRAALADRERVAFVLVLLPERLPIEESARAAHQLEDAGIHLGGIIVNRVLPDKATGAYFEARKAQERIRLAEIERRLAAAPRVLVPQLESDVQGVAGLERIARSLLG